MQNIAQNINQGLQQVVAYLSRKSNPLFQHSGHAPALPDIWTLLKEHQARGWPTVGPDDSGQIFQIITGRWEMRSLTERRWLVMPRKIWVLCYTPHERCTCDRIFGKKVKNRNSYLRSIFENKIWIYPTCIFLTYQDEVNSVMGNMTGSLYTPAPVLHWWQKIVLSMGY